MEPKSSSTPHPEDEVNALLLSLHLSLAEMDQLGCVSSNLVFPAIAIAIGSAHWHFLGEHVLGGLQAAYSHLSTTQQEASANCSGDCVSQRLAKIRAFNYSTASLMGIHFALLVALERIFRFLREPCIANTLPILVVLLLGYLPDATAICWRAQLTNNTLTRLSFLLCSFFHTYCLACVAETSSAMDHISMLSLMTTGHVLAGLVFLNARMWIPSTTVLFVSQLAVFLLKFGYDEVSPTFLLNYFQQLLQSCTILAVVEIGICAHLKLESDSRSPKCTLFTLSMSWFQIHTRYPKRNALVRGGLLQDLGQQRSSSDDGRFPKDLKGALRRLPSSGPGDDGAWACFSILFAASTLHPEEL